jgi:hypothetical protein
LARAIGDQNTALRAFGRTPFASPLVAWKAHSYISEAMHSVVAHNADPYLELDAPALFSNHLDALKYAIGTAIVFRAAEGGPTGFSISGPDGSVQWFPIEVLCSHVVRFSVGLL